jgi:hypothetical protein
MAAYSALGITFLGGCLCLLLKGDRITLPPSIDRLRDVRSYPWWRFLAAGIPTVNFSSDVLTLAEVTKLRAEHHDGNRPNTMR